MSKQNVQAIVAVGATLSELVLLMGWAHTVFMWTTNSEVIALNV